MPRFLHKTVSHCMKSYFAPFIQHFQFISWFLYTHIFLPIFMKLVIHGTLYLFILNKQRLRRLQLHTGIDFSVSYYSVLSKMLTLHSFSVLANIEKKTISRTLLLLITLFKQLLLVSQSNSQSNMCVPFVYHTRLAAR